MQQNKKINKTLFLWIVLIFVLMPATILFGTLVLENRKYYFISFLTLFYSMLPFIVVFEKKRPNARELVILAVLSAIGVAGRAAFFMLPQFKPVAAIVIIAGVSFGGQAGFLVGAVTAFASNLMFGQGPWTPWQMFAFGIIGLLAGIFHEKKILKTTRVPLCIFGGFATFFIYGILLDTASVLMFMPVPTWQAILASFISGALFNAIHAAATVFFLFILSKPMLQKLERIKIKYGLLQ